MPGYFTIPYNYKIDEMSKFFYENKLEILQIKKIVFN
jgi:hypothetical protein